MFFCVKCGRCIGYLCWEANRGQTDHDDDEVSHRQVHDEKVSDSAGGETMAVRQWQKSRRIYIHPRMGRQWLAVAKVQEASVPIA